MAKFENLEYIPTESIAYPADEGFNLTFAGCPSNPTDYGDEIIFSEFTEEDIDQRKSLWKIIEAYIKPEASKVDLAKLAFDTKEFGNRVLTCIIRRFDFSSSSRILIKQPQILWQEYVSGPNVKRVQTLTTAFSPDKAVVISDGENGELIVAYL